MTITLTDAAIGSGLGAPVPPISLTIPDGAVSVVAVETDERPLLVSMLIGARVRAEYGSVAIDGVEDARRIRRSTALIDTPFVSEPPAGVALATTVREELSFSDLPTSRNAVASFLRRTGLEEYARIPVRALPPVDRIRVFAELALLRSEVRRLVITSPERHGAAPEEWYRVLSAITDRGIAVIVVTDALTRASLLELGALDATAPVILLERAAKPNDPEEIEGLQS